MEPFSEMRCGHVWGTSTGWPDLIVAGIMASLFLWSAALILRQAMEERNQASLAEAG